MRLVELMNIKNYVLIMHLLRKQRILKNLRIFGFISFFLFLITILSIRPLTFYVFGEKQLGVIYEYNVRKGGGKGSYFVLYIKDDEAREMRINHNFRLSNSLNDIVSVYCANYFGIEMCFTYEKEVDTSAFFLYSLNIPNSVNRVEIFIDDNLVKTIDVSIKKIIGYETTKTGHFQVYFDSILVSDFIAEKENNNFKEIH